MGHAEDAAEGVCQAVGYPQRGIGEGHARHAGGVVHLFARQQVVAAAPAGRQIAKYLLHHFLRQRVGKVAGGAGDVGLKGVTQHVHAGVGGNCRRHRSHQRRVKNGDIRQQRRIHQHQLLRVGFHHRKGGDFRTGTAGGGDGDKAWTRPVILRTGLRQGENNRFGGIDYRTAAERDNQIRIVVIHQLHAAHHGGDIRIGHHVVPHLPGDPALAQQGGDALGEAKLDHRLIGHQQYAAGGEFVQHREGVLTEANPRFQ